jgi:hypothetical protein
MSFPGSRKSDRARPLNASQALFGVIMRPSLPLFAIASVVVLAACVGDRIPTAAPPMVGPKGPQFDHVGGTVPTVDVDVNNYVLQLRPDYLFNGFYKGTGTLFAGEFSYGNAPDAVVFHNTRGTGGPHLEGAGLPIESSAPGPFADHQTLSVMIERTGQELGPAVPVGLIVVRETFAFDDAPDDDYLVLKYTLYNPGATSVANLHVGQILDDDLGGFSDDVVEYLSAEDLVRVSSAIEATPVAGHAILRMPATSYRGFGRVGGMLTDAATLAGWFEFLSVGIVSPAPFGGNGDIRHALSLGPVTIPAGEAEVFAFVLAGGDDGADLAANVAAARAKYDALPLAARQPYPVVEADVAIEPSPLDLREATEFTAILSGVPRKLLPFVDAAHLFCGVPPATASPATALVRLKNRVRATFPVTNLSVRLRFRPGDEIVCAGRLTDGTLVAGRTTPAAVVSLPLAPVTQLTSLGVNRAPTWSPDGSSIAFSSDRSGTFAIWRMNVASGEASATQVTSGPDDRAPDWFGATIVFGREGQIYSVSDAGGAVTLVNMDGTNPRFSPDGSTIAFTRVTGGFHVWTMAVGGSAEMQVTTGAFEFHPEWSPTGSEIYFTDFSVQRGAIIKVPAAGGTPDGVTPEEGTDNRHPAVSPDGELLAFVSASQFGVELVLQDLTTGHHTLVPLDPQLPDIPLAGAEVNQNLEFSPDGTKLLFAAGGHIWVADLSAVVP